MQSSKCLFDLATALRRIFVNGAVASDAGILQQQASCQFLRFAHQSIQQQCQALSGSRRFSTQPIRFRIAKNSGYLAAERAQAEKKETLPRDDQIRAHFVHIIGPNGISKPMPTFDVLADLDPRYESLVMVARGAGRDEVEPRDEDGRPRLQWPVCKIVDIQQEKQEEYQKKKEERKKLVESKELEINWGIAPNDLEMTKLRQLRKFLAKGLKVQIRLLTKGGRGKRAISKEDANNVLNAIKAAVAEVPGSKESKIEGEVGKSMTIVFQGPAKGSTPAPPPPTTDSTTAPAPESAAPSAS